MSSFLYFDHNSSTPLLPEVEKSIKKSFKAFGNPSGLHGISRQSRENVEQAREDVARFFQRDPSQVLFTGSATEANNMVLKRFLPTPSDPRPHVIISAVEHSSVRNSAGWLASMGVDISIAPVCSNGLVQLDALKNLIKESTQLISVMAVNNETGLIQPLEEIHSLCESHHIPLHCDAVQAVGKLIIDKPIKADFVTLSAHKCYGPKGVGALITTNEDALKPLLHGGEHERKLRAGTENTLGIVGFASALNWLSEHQESVIDHYKMLKKLFLEALLDSGIPHHLNGSSEQTIPNTVNVSFDGIDGVALAMALDLEGIAVSTGSACATGSIEPSPVLLAMGYPKERVNSAIRVSFGKDNSMVDVKTLVSALAKITGTIS